MKVSDRLYEPLKRSETVTNVHKTFMQTVMHAKRLGMCDPKQSNAWERIVENAHAKKLKDIICFEHNSVQLGQGLFLIIFDNSTFILEF
jgi:hypothetical protein